MTELTDRTENALKIVGDVYAARLFAVEQTSMARGEVLEITVVVILVIELALFLAGVMHL